MSVAFLSTFGIFISKDRKLKPTNFIFSHFLFLFLKTYYIESMPHPEDIQSNLESQFEKVDEMYANEDLRVFGNTKKYITYL
jgi:hypothetical protein